MDKSDIRGILLEILETDESEMSDTAVLSELGFDSIRFINFVVEIETEFNIEIYDSDLDIENFNSIDAIFKTLKKYFDEEKTIYKCVITDCDGVLWHGISGESGADKAYFNDKSISMGKFLHDLRKRGVLLAVCSKNEQKNIESMLSDVSCPLSRDDFAVIETECDNKAEAVQCIISQLGFFSENVIFLDDSDYEIGLINEYLPEVKALKVQDDRNFVDGLAELFENLPEVSAIDRTAQFREQKEREKIHIASVSPKEYNSKLDTVIACGYADKSDIERMSELSERTNRFNMTGCRYSREDIGFMIDNADYKVYTLRASDKYGDMGLVAMAVVHNGIIESFMLSCRVFGRDFEKVMLEKIKSDASGKLCGMYVPTEKNSYCRAFYKNNGVKYYE